MRLIRGRRSGVSGHARYRRRSGPGQLRQSERDCRSPWCSDMTEAAWLPAGAYDRIALIEGGSGEPVTYGSLRERVARAAVELRAAAGDCGIAMLLVGNDIDRSMALWWICGSSTGRVVWTSPGRRSAAYSGHNLSTRSCARPYVCVARDRWNCAAPGAGPVAVHLGDVGQPATGAFVEDLRDSQRCGNSKALPQRYAVAVTSLPIHYAYGLSVVTSHLRVGATVLLTEDPLVSPKFWQLCRDHRVTSQRWCPFTYEALLRIDLAVVAPPSLQSFTQAGGAMTAELVRHFDAMARARGGGLTIMYGQTEATARMAVLPPDHSYRLAPAGSGRYPGWVTGHCEQRAA